MAATDHHSVPRVSPGTRAELGSVNFALTRLIGAATGGRPPNVFTTLARHRRLFRRWLRFAGGLMPGGVLARADTELLILRVAGNCASPYEWSHHERLGLRAGLSPAAIEATRPGADDTVLSDGQRLLIRAADELHATKTLSDELWTALSATHSEVELIELCMLVGHYEMLAMTLNALKVQLDPAPIGGPRGRLRLVESFVRRRRTGQTRAGRGA